MSTNAHDTDPTGWTLDQWDTCNIYILLYTFVNISVKIYWMLFLPGSLTPKVTSLLDSTDFVIQRNHLILWKRLKFQMPSKHSFIVHNKASNTCYWPKLCLLYEAKAAGRGKKMLKRFLAAVLLSASVERFFISCMKDFYYGFVKSSIKGPPISLWGWNLTFVL